MFSYPGKPHANGTRWMYQFPAYPWLNFCQYAAAGQYDRAESSLEVISELFERNEASLAPRYTAILSVQAAAEAAIAAPTGSLFDRVILAQLVEVQRDHLIQARNAIRSPGRSEHSGGYTRTGTRSSQGRRKALMLAKRLFEDVRPFASSLPGLAIANRYLDALEHQR